MVADDRLVALYGVPFASDSDPATDTDTFVANFLNQHAGALGVDDCVLDLVDKINIRDKFTVYTYRQTIPTENLHDARRIHTDGKTARSTSGSCRTMQLLTVRGSKSLWTFCRGLTSDSIAIASLFGPHHQHRRIIRKL
jgi:hypothetical protein